MQAEIYLSNLQKGMILSQAIQLINSDRVDGSRPQQWADIGCGNGIFSRALLSLLHKDSIIYAIDKQPARLKEENIKFIQQDFETDPLSLPPLDGLIMANSLHFVKNKPAFLQNIRKHLVPGGIFILVEYDTDVSNRYVPWPISFDSAAALFKQAGFEQFEKINERPSIFNRAMMYGAHCIIPNS
jgi:ubiquinone/menaquinone biosynthesis C-methylase UbiE